MQFLAGGVQRFGGLQQKLQSFVYRRLVVHSVLSLPIAAVCAGCLR
jgi:hypothetical protein